MGTKPTYALLAFLPLAGCVLGGEISVTQAGRDVAFEIKDHEGRRACPTRVEVAVWREHETDAAVWTIVTDEFPPDENTCGEKLVYGRVPPGFRQVTGPAPLQTGTLYSVSAQVPGHSASALFSPGDRDGVINREAPAE